MNANKNIYSMMVCLSIILIFVIATLIVIKSVDINFGNNSLNAVEIPLEQLIYDPELYHDKLVKVYGICNFEWERDALYIGAYDYAKRIAKNAVWLTTESKGKNNKLIEAFYLFEKANGRSVLIEGVFNKDNHGMWGRYSGAIEKITRIQAL